MNDLKVVSNTNWKRWGAAGGLVLLAAGYALRRRQHPLAPQPKEIAPGVWRLQTGRAFMKSNVYFVRSGSSWVLIDAAWPNCSQVIKQAAETLFGAGSRPAAIVLTHIHADHTGSAVELARLWGCPVYVHPDELPFAAPANLSTVEQYANPLDRRVILPLLRVMPRARVESLLSDTSLKDVTRAFEPGTAVPGLPDWECIPTPGHTPGHVSFFRESDRVLIAGDALLTVNPNSLWDCVLQKQQVSGPPYISTWNWRAAKDSIAVLAKLEPRVIAGGHGIPMTGPDTAHALRVFADQSGVGREQQRARAPQRERSRPNMALELCWASREERRRRMAGDDLVPHPMAAIMHAITITAPPEAVWPWLIQMGSGRAGWYAYDWIDNGSTPSARDIIPELQHVAVGDVMPWLPGAQDGFIVWAVIPERALILIAPLEMAVERSAAASGTSAPALRASWTLVLEPMNDGRTRLIARGRISRDWLAAQAATVTTPGEPIFIERVYGLLAKMPWPLLLPVAGLGHYLMESRMLRGIKRRAERHWAEERAGAKASSREEIHH